MVMVQLIGCTLVVLVEDEEFFFCRFVFFRSWRSIKFLRFKFNELREGGRNFLFIRQK